MENPITLLAQDIQLDETTALSLQDKFLPFLEQAEQWKADALAIVVTDASQTEAMETARKMRLQIRDFRIIVEKTRKDLKEESLRKWQAIDRVSNIIKSIVEPIEEYLEKQEKFVLIQEKMRKAELKAKRLELLAPYQVNTEFVKLEEMTDEQFEKFLLEWETTYNLKIAEEKRLAEQAEQKAKEDQKLREDNARLEAENRAKDEAIAKANQEKAEAEAKQRAEQEAKLKLQQDEAYIAFLATYWCTPATKDQFTTKKMEDWSIVLYKAVATYNPIWLTPIDPRCWF